MKTALLPPSVVVICLSLISKSALIIAIHEGAGRLWSKDLNTIFLDHSCSFCCLHNSASNVPHHQQQQQKILLECFCFLKYVQFLLQGSDQLLKALKKTLC